MHIAAAHMNPHAAHSSVSASVLAARRADETRRKLASASTELDAVPTSESAWMIDAWSGGGSGGHSPDRHSDQHPHQQLDQGTGQASASSSDQISGLSPVQAGFQSSAQVVNQIATAASRPLLTSGPLPPSGEEIRRTPATGAVSFWA
jgi:hypothetical protein